MEKTIAILLIFCCMQSKAQNVGIGTASPDNKLTVSGDADITGKVGIGIKTPGAQLHINDAAGTQVNPSANLVLSRVWLSSTNTRASSIFHYYSPTTYKDNLAFAVSGGGGTNDAPNAISQIKMMIQANGFVGIGTTTPANKLTVSGNVDFTGKLGIGTNAPGAYLHINDTAGTLTNPSANLVLSRLWGSPTNTRASSIFHYYSPTTDKDNLAFAVSGSGGTNDAPNAISQIKMMIQANGFVGIGTTTPANKLTVSGNVDFAGKLGIGTNAPGAHLHINDIAGTLTNPSANLVLSRLWGSPTNTRASSIFHYYSPTTDKDNLAFAVSGSGGTNDAPNAISQIKMMIQANGFVGIGTNAPGAQLHINDAAGTQVNPSANLVLSRVWLSPTNTRASSIFHYYNPTTSKDNLAFAVSGGGGTNDAPNAISQIKMMIQGNGFVGIGTTSPEAPLHVNITSQIGDKVGNVYYNLSWRNFTGPTQTSIIGAGTIIGQGFWAVSDARVKNIISISNSAKDLELLNRLKITDYNYIDKVINGSKVSKKIIAQEVEQVLPNAVSKGTNFIPDIYAVPTKISVINGKLNFSLEKMHHLKVGDKLKWIDDNDEEQQSEITAILSPYIFEINYKANYAKAFIYGRQVNDFRTVDYEAIAMLNVSATQELSKKLEAANTKIGQLEKQKSETEARLKVLEIKIGQLAMTTVTKY